MAHVCVEGFAAGHTQYHRAQQGKGVQFVVHKESQSVVGRDGRQDSRLLDQMIQPQSPQHRKPDQHNRPKQLAQRSCPALLKGEQTQQNHGGDAHHPLPQPFIDQL